MADKVTPEEKLLKLIENPGAENLKVKSGKKPIAMSSVLELGKGIKQIAELKEKLASHIFNFKFMIHALIALSAVLTVYLVLDFLGAKPDMNKIYTFAASPLIGNVKGSSADRQDPILNLTDYLSQIEQRDIFHFVPLKKAEAPLPAKEKLLSAGNNLKLVGIIWSQNPQAMVEDKKENKTTLVSPGDTIGDLKVKQILKDRIILGFEDQEIELL